jgi:TatA/E family protein of Tat protein translocase
MLSLSHLVIIIIAALVFLGPEKIPQFLKSCGEGIVLFKDTINKTNLKENENQNQNKKNKKKNKKFQSNKIKNKNKKRKKIDK